MALAFVELLPSPTLRAPLLQHDVRLASLVALIASAHITSSSPPAMPCHPKFACGLTLLRSGQPTHATREMRAGSPSSMRPITCCSPALRCRITPHALPSRNCHPSTRCGATPSIRLVSACYPLRWCRITLQHGSRLTSLVIHDGNARATLHDVCQRMIDIQLPVAHVTPSASPCGPCYHNLE
jgi:hypothetical protein